MPDWRLKILDECFSNRRRKYFIDDLVKKCNEKLEELSSGSGVSTRTIQADIRHIRLVHQAPLESYRDGKKTYYRYADEGYTIYKRALNDEEKTKLLATIKAIKSLHGIPQLQILKETELLLEEKLQANNEPVIEFDHNSALKGIEHLDALYHYIYEKKCICLSYKKFDQHEPKQHLLHPYFLKQYNGRWFLFALSDAHNEIRSFSIDRVIAVEPLDMDYIPNDFFNFSETENQLEYYFESIVGINRQQNTHPEEVVLKFSPGQINYILTAPLHHSQKEKMLNDGSMMITLTVWPNYELEELILRFGEGVEVLAPEHFRKHISNRLQQSLTPYKNGTLE